MDNLQDIVVELYAMIELSRSTGEQLLDMVADAETCLDNIFLRLKCLNETQAKGDKNGTV